MKNLLVFLLVLAAVGLFFHDKQQTADLTQARSDNVVLTQQFQDKEAAYNGLQLKVQQLTAQIAQISAQGAMQSHLSPPGAPAATPDPGAWRLQDSGALDRPAYKN